MNRPVVAVDFDDVVINFNLAFLLFNNREYGTSVTYEGIHSFEMERVYGVDEDEMKRRVYEFCHGHHHTIVPIDGAAKSLARLSKLYDLQIVTSRCQSLSEITRLCLEAHVPGVIRDFHFTNSFSSRHPELRRSKLSVCLDIGARLLIEDAPVNAVNVAEAGIPVVMPDRPWNRTFSHKNVVRARTWEAKERLIPQLLKVSPIA